MAIATKSGAAVAASDGDGKDDEEVNMSLWARFAEEGDVEAWVRNVDYDLCFGSSAGLSVAAAMISRQINDWAEE